MLHEVDAEEEHEGAKSHEWQALAQDRGRVHEVDAEGNVPGDQQEGDQHCGSGPQPEDDAGGDQERDHPRPSAGSGTNRSTSRAPMRRAERTIYVWDHRTKRGERASSRPPTAAPMPMASRT